MTYALNTLEKASAYVTELIQELEDMIALFPNAMNGENAEMADNLRQGHETHKNLFDTAHQSILNGEDEDDHGYAILLAESVLSSKD